MPCHNPETVADALVGRLCAVEVGPYRVEYINDAGPGVFVESEHLAVIERHGVTDIVTVGSAYFNSLVESYGARGVSEAY